MKNKAVLVLHCDQKSNYRIRLLLDNIFGEDNFINEIIWLYKAGGGPGRRKFRNIHDTLYVYSKEKDYFFQPILRNKYGSSLGDCWHIKSLADKAGIFAEDDECKSLAPYQKPKELFKRFIETFTNRGNLVLDPFVGSGTTAIACLGLGRHCIGIDNNPDVIKLAEERIKKEKLSVR